MTTATWPLRVLERSYAVVRLPATAQLPGWLAAGELVSVARTAEELSIICPVSMVPAEMELPRTYRALKVDCPLEPDEVGVLASLLEPLAAADVSILAVSTFLTDYIFVAEDDVAEAVTALRSAGHRIVAED